MSILEKEHRKTLITDLKSMGLEIGRDKPELFVVGRTIYLLDFEIQAATVTETVLVQILASKHDFQSLHQYVLLGDTRVNIGKYNEVIQLEKWKSFYAP